MASLPKPCKEHPTKEIWQAQAHLWNITFDYVNSMALKCAMELGVADIIHRHGNLTPLNLLLSDLSIPPSRTACFRRLMRLLVHAGIFASSTTAHGEEAYSLTAVSETFLVREKSEIFSPLALFILDAPMLDPWSCLSRWLTTDDPATCFHATHGKSVFELAGEDSKFNTLLNETMACDAHLVAAVLVREHGDAIFGGLTSLVDVGGGNGAMAMAIAEAFPQVKCTVLELPHVVASSEGCTRVEAVAGDMFESIPPADAVLLKWVLHDWSDEDCVRILKNCKAAIPPRERGGKVIIVEMVMDLEDITHEMAETQLAFDVYIMVEVPGKQRSSAEWRNIFMAAGFSDHKIMPILGLRSVIELYY